MVRRVIYLLIVVCSLAVSNAQDKPEEKDEASRWEETIRVFEDWDRKNSFPTDAVLFAVCAS